MANNLQDVIDDPDLEDVLIRSRTEWLDHEDLRNILGKREDLLTSTVPVPFPEEGLFLFDVDEQDVLDTTVWDLTNFNKMHGDFDIRYRVDQCFLVPINEGVSSTYERRVYKCEQLYGTYRVVHYRRYHMSDDNDYGHNSGEDTEDSQNLGNSDNDSSDDDGSSNDDDGSSDDESHSSDDESAGDDNIEAHANGF
ncbi:unnamed protein product [Arabidopsis thaliana]|uniref:Uncharacterized protein n=2 Tax=Arabidopsis thaliana TaxID=3702 RepID=Q9LUQ8_ARATH|nr:uncharacterized protein AT3G16750 [Arabidopsis thaliana]NP_188297.1 uncharacterized protein AT3G16750 [Arabidopsis thaliana]AAT69216.1 hypothetical protein At3g16750 [Arabidopsis thaliana]AEE75860.1 hypothetical protein AT3G16750 [Arabidopsis thaliana]ANM63857.1 hypothetical protein AT3G16750 [Arabidopsis thaliana]VYS57615.1 unnamed protein product [Arabidopsis thaliana]BAB02767.1 unnamed protein product [Arabidopsis thaliana]|eukprot:NP_001325925.1 hypothetical protein AT3G16750 [Arabidopsis thaliana]